MRLLKTCGGDHDVGAPCAACDEDDTLCDLCWESSEDPELCRTVVTPERCIAVDNGTGVDKSYVVCAECYSEYRRRVELELI